MVYFGNTEAASFLHRFNRFISLKPIGVVRNEIKETGKKDWNTVVSEIIFDPSWQKALSHIEEFSHLIIIYWMHRVLPEQRQITEVHPGGRQDLPLVGVFASRSPMRPNPLGVTTVKLIGRDGNILKVSGLDAIDGTPVLDIKPYIPSYDSPAEAKTPDWVRG